MAQAVRADTEATEVIILVKDSYIGTWTGTTEYQDTPNAPSISLSWFTGTIERARSEENSGCHVALDDGRRGDFVLLADTVDLTIGAVLFGITSSTQASRKKLINCVRSCLFRSLIISGVGSKLLIRHGCNAKQADVHRTTSFEVIIARCSSLAARLLGAESAGIMLHDLHTNRMTIVKPAFGIDDESLLRQYCVSLSSPANSVKVYRTGTPYISHDCLSDSRTPLSVMQGLKVFNVHKLLVVPLLGCTGPIGVINVVNKMSGEFSEEDARIVQAMGTVFGSLIEEHREHERLSQERTVLESRLKDKSKELESIKFQVTLTDTLLSCMVSENMGLKPMITKLSMLLNRQLAVYNMNGVIVTQEPQQRGCLAAGLDTSFFVRLSSSERKTLIFDKNNVMDDITPTNGGANGALPHVCLSSTCVVLQPIAAGHRILGYLALSGFDDDSFTQEDRLTTERACTYLAAEIMRHQAELGTAETRGSVLVNSLLDGCSSMDQLRDVSSSLGRSIDPPFCVVVARRPRQEDKTPVLHNANAYLRILRSLFEAVAGRNWLMTHRQTEWVAICALRTLDPVRRAIAMEPTLLGSLLTATLQDRGEIESLQIGIGPACETVEAIPSSYNEARVAAIIGPVVHKCTITCAEDLGIYRLLAQIGQRDILIQFAYKTLRGLMDEDSIKSTRLIATLECYLDCHGHISQTSEKLFIHPNTLRYRPSCIQELLNCDINDPTDRLSLTVSIKAFRLASMMDEDISVPI
ncbi:MAG: GAF domain-containing protein [Actinobacteria bacterium]|nr:GAF domain-containing protein [Actinomycetota bacterium]